MTLPRKPALPGTSTSADGAVGARIARHLGPLAALAALGLAAYCNAFGAGFTYDDFPSIVQDPAIHDLGRFFARINRANREVTYLTFALNYRAGALEPFGYHAVNVAIHLVNSALVYALVTLAFRTRRLRESALSPSARAIGFASAALFVTHPVQTEAVTYVVQRLASLTTTFYLATVLLYLRWRLGRESGHRHRAHPVFYWGSVACAVVAMYTKQTAFTLPLAACLVEWLFFEGPRRRWIALAPLLATMTLIPLRMISWSGKPLVAAVSSLELPRVQTTMSRADYLATQASVVVQYLRLLVLPVGQNVDHDHPEYHSFLRPEVLAPAAVIVALLALALYLWRGARRGRLDQAALLASFGILWFFLALGVESTLIPIVDVMVEHRVYLPSVGAFVATAIGGAAAARRIFPERPDRKLVAAATLLSVVLAAASFTRNTVWQSELTLWADAAAKSPGKARPLNNLGAALSDAGRPDEAIATLESAIRAHPRHADAYYNLGRVYLNQRQHEAAIILFRTAIALKPDYADAHSNLAATLLQLRRFEEVVSLLERAAEVVRDAPESQFNLGVAYVALGDSVAAERQQALLRGSSPELAAALARFASESAQPR